MGVDVKAKIGRSISQHSLGKISIQSIRANKQTKSMSGISRCSSRMSQKSTKSVKQINASLERVHTFSMSFVHK